MQRNPRLVLGTILVALAAGSAAGQGFYPSDFANAWCAGSGGVLNPARDGVLADLDQDGDDDFAGLGGVQVPPIGIVGAPHITVCKSVGGALAIGVCHSTLGLIPAAIAAGDLNGDSYRDLAVVCTGPPFALLVFLNDGTGAFPTPPVVTFLTQGYAAVHIATINADANPDVVLISAPGPSLILLGAGGGTFGAPLPGPTTASPIANAVLRDDDLDGDDDLHEVTGGAFVTYRNNSATFTGAQVRFVTGAPTGFAAFGDFNFDGNLDAAVIGVVPPPPASAPVGQPFIQLATGNGAGTFTPGPLQLLATASPLVRVFMKDFDADGDLDLVTSTAQGLFYAANVGATFPNTFPVLQHGGSSVAFGSSVAGDVTGDGIADVLALRSFYPFAVPPSTNAWLLHQGVASRGIARATDFSLSGGKVFRAADLDNDGFTDVVAAHRSPLTGTPTEVGLFWALNADAPTNPAAGIVWPASAEIADIATGDWNRDGLVDVVLARTTDLAINLGPSASWVLSWGGPTSIPVAGPPNRSIVAADANGDGLLDVIVNQSTVVTTLFGDGAGFFVGSAVTPICPTPPGCGGTPTIACGDLNGDGYVDLVVNSPVTTLGPRLSVYSGNGTGAFTLIGSTPCVASNWPPALEDLNGDAIPDLVLSSTTGGLEVRLGLGGGAFGFPLTYVAAWLTTTAFLGGDLALGDVNGDGFPDVALAGGAVFLNDGTGAFTLNEVIGVASSLWGTPQRVLFAHANRDLQPDLLFQWPIGLIAVHRNAQSCAATGYTYGFGCSGAGGFVPELSAFGCASPGGLLTLKVTDALGGATTAALVVGAGPANVPLAPGCSVLIQLAGALVVPFPILGPPIAGQGAGALTVTMPPTIPPGTAVAIQAAVLDPAAALGWSATNGLALVIQ